MTEFKSRGILHQQNAKFQIDRHRPSPDIGICVEHYWLIRWDLRDQPPHIQENLPYPCVHLALEQEIAPDTHYEAALIYGVVTGKFTRTLAGMGQVFGVKFKPASFYPVLQSSVAALTDHVIPLAQIFGPACQDLSRTIFALPDDTDRITAMEGFLRAHLPEPDATVCRINDMVDSIIRDREILKVEDVAARFNLGTRTLQRLFQQYVGVSPKWVIKRFRLHEAIERMTAGEAHDWPKLAVELGYFDQAHFIKDFKTLVGQTPAEYARQCSKSGQLTRNSGE
ncbi:MAG: helix-turn-helix domain-containing protein [Anaerolineae bacterium]|nr:helix-turn-helix domain-containing protein [Anaerolineae bacterium]